MKMARTEIPIDISPPKITTKKGRPALIFKKDEYIGKLVDRCKFTLIGKFSKTKLRIEVIRRSFISQTQLIGGVKIAHFNSRHVYIDLDNEVDHVNIWTKQRMYINGQPMRL